MGLQKIARLLAQPLGYVEGGRKQRANARIGEGRLRNIGQGAEGRQSEA